MKEHALGNYILAMKLTSYVTVGKFPKQSEPPVSLSVRWENANLRERSKYYEN